MKAPRFAASVLIIGAILALYRTLLPVNNTTVALTLRRSRAITAFPATVSDRKAFLEGPQ
jgi:hypothetical protein